MLLSIYVGNKNHIGVIYSSYSNSLEVSCSNSQVRVKDNCEI